MLSFLKLTMISTSFTFSKANSPFITYFIEKLLMTGLLSSEPCSDL